MNGNFCIIWELKVIKCFMIGSDSMLSAFFSNPVLLIILYWWAPLGGPEVPLGGYTFKKHVLKRGVHCNQAVLICLDPKSYKQLLFFKNLYFFWFLQFSALFVAIFGLLTQQRKNLFAVINRMNYEANYLSMIIKIRFCPSIYIFYYIMPSFGLSAICDIILFIH